MDRSMITNYFSFVKIGTALLFAQIYLFIIIIFIFVV